MGKKEQKQEKTVKDILKDMLRLELAGLTAILGITMLMLAILYSSMQVCQSSNIGRMQRAREIQYTNADIQNICLKLMLSGEDRKDTYSSQINEMDMTLQRELKELKEKFPETERTVGEIQDLLQQALTCRSQAILLAVTGRGEEAVFTMEQEYHPVMEQVNVKLEELSLDSQDAVDDSLGLIKNSIFFFGGVGAVVIILLGTYITIKQHRVTVLITEPLEEVQQAMGEMAKGNLEFTVEYPNKNEFGMLADSLTVTGKHLKTYVQDISRVIDKVADKDFTVTVDADYEGMFAPIGNSMEHIVESMQNVIRSIRDSSQNVFESSRDLNVIAEQLFASAEKEKEHAETVENEMDQLMEATKENLAAAERMHQISSESDMLIKDGHIAVRSLASVIGHVEGTFAQITDILVLTREVSEQIKLLTLNASIEAARAGENGRGFAVLANQMRTLVEKSQEATGKTENLIANGEEVIREGQKIAEDVLEKFISITDIEDSLVKRAERVQILSKQQEEVLCRVYDVTEEMVQMALGYDTVSQEIKEQGKQVNQMAENLTEEMQKFKIA